MEKFIAIENTFYNIDKIVSFTGFMDNDQYHLILAVEGLPVIHVWDEEGRTAYRYLVAFAYNVGDAKRFKQTNP